MRVGFEWSSFGFFWLQRVVNVFACERSGGASHMVVMTVVSLTRTTRETKEVLYHSNGIPLSIKKVHKNYLVLTIANLFS